MSVKSAGEILAQANHPWGLIILDWLARGRRGSLDDALGLNEPVSRDDHYRFVVEFVAEYLQRNPQHSIPAAHKFYLIYARRFEFTRARVDGGHTPGSLEHLCWKIYNVHPEPITSVPGFRMILRKSGFRKQ